MKRNYIVICSLAACILLYLIEQVVKVDYLTKTLAKIILFTLIPYIYVKCVKGSTLKEFISYKKIDGLHLRLGFLLGVASFAAIFAAYYFFGSLINLQDIVQELQDKSKVTPGNFIFVGLYITLGNSFLEEFFFRGFVFLKLFELKPGKTAYIYSSLLFGAYHIAIFKTWFDAGLIGLSLAGLVGIGLVFDWLDTKSENFINSWLVHILADSAVILIGLKMFHLI